MKTLKLLLLIVSFSLIATSNAWAINVGKKVGRGDHGRNKGGYPKAPEIDAASATIPLALLTSLVLLMTERSRFRRSSESEA